MWCHTVQMVSGSNTGFPTAIVDIQVMGDRIFVCDLQESVFVLRYKPAAPFHPLLVFAEDCAPKWVTSLTILDYDTIAFSDKFANVHVVRALLQYSNTPTLTAYTYTYTYL